MSNLKAYLAEKYMSGPKADAILAKTGPLKKKKRKHKDGTGTGASLGTSMIQDEDGGWGDAPKDVDEEEASAAVVASDRSFKKRKVANGAPESSWVTVQEGMGEESGVGKEESPPPPQDEQPMVVDEPGGVAPLAGLIKHGQKKKKRPDEDPEAMLKNMTAEEIALAQETVYRDVHGQKVDMKLLKAEAARLKRQKEEKEAEKLEWGKGLVQREAAEKRRQELEKQKDKGFRRVDDSELNEDLKSKELWNDPAAAFLSKKRSKGPRKPEYSGPPPPPNRFSIKPGYRWDGVDRSNGFEKKYFQSHNARKRKGAESYQWGVEDM